MAEYNNTNGAGSGQPLKDFGLNSNVSEKLDFKFGKDLAQTIKGAWGGVTSYYWLRNTRFLKNRRIANGRMNMQAFVDQLQMNSKTNYVNINWSAIKLANKIISSAVNKWADRPEKIVVTAQDLQSRQDRQDAADQAEFVMDNKAMLDELESESGVPMVPEGQFVANDKDELDEWVSEFNRTPEEIKYELGTNYILQANGWFDTLKRKILQDSAEVGLLATEVYMNRQGEVIVEWVRPENTFYSYSEFDDFRDTTYRGRIKSVKIGELKKYAQENGGRLTADDFYNLVQSAREYQYIDKLRWVAQWDLNMYQIYDDWTVDVMYFYVKSLDRDNYTVTKTKIHNSTLIQKGNIVRKDNQSSLTDEKWNMYKGVYARDADIMLEWGLQENMIIPQDPKEVGNVEFPISLYMYQNYEMRNVAVPEKIEEPLEQMILARLKIQQLVASLKPVGAAINVDAMQELDLGLAELTTPIEAERLWRQTGNLYYRGRDAEGKPIPIPIQELTNSGFLPQMQGLISLYQFHFQVLKDELGSDPNLSQQAIQPRVTEGNVDTARMESDSATEHMYFGYKYIMGESGKKVACLLHKSVVYDAKAYRDILNKDAVKGRYFATKVEMLPTIQEQQKIEVMMNNMIAAAPDMMNFINPFRIMRVAKENTKLAELFLLNGQKRYIKWQADTATKNSQENGQIQQQSLQQKAEADSMLMDKEQNNEERNILLKGALDAIAKGVPLDENTKVVFDAILQNVAMPLMAENAEIQQALAAAAMQAQEGQMAPQQEQVQPQV